MKGANVFSGYGYNSKLLLNTYPSVPLNENLKD
jgi:hypothetical protein